MVDKHDALVGELRRLARDSGATQASIARATGWHQSAISRVLAGKKFPDRRLVLGTVHYLGGDQDHAKRLYEDAIVERETVRALRARLADGAPPRYLDRDDATAADLCRALRGLMYRRGLTQAETVRRDLTGRLTRSRLSKIATGRITPKSRDVAAIIWACGAAEATLLWEAAWARITEPAEQAKSQRREDHREWWRSHRG